MQSFTKTLARRWLAVGPLTLALPLACGSNVNDGFGGAAASAGQSGAGAGQGGGVAGASAQAGTSTAGSATAMGGASSGAGGSAGTTATSGSGGAVTNAGTAGASTTGGNAGATGGAGTTGGSAGTPGTAGTSGSAGSAGSSSGCGMTGAATGVLSNQMITVGTQARTYILSVPAAYDPNRPYPLVFAWHGLGGSGSLARNYFRVEQQAAGGAIFVYPDGLPVANQGNVPGWDLGANGIDVQLFDAVLASVSGRYCIASSRIFSTGHSFGGFFSNRLACSRGNVLRAIAPVAGAPPFGMATCTGEVGAWIAHGMNDPTVQFSQGEATREFWSSRNTCTATSAMVSPEPCVALQGCAADRPVHWCAHAGAHEWPSFAAAGIWSFFQGFN